MRRIEASTLAHSHDELYLQPDELDDGCEDGHMYRQRWCQKKTQMLQLQLAALLKLDDGLSLDHFSTL